MFRAGTLLKEYRAKRDFTKTREPDDRASQRRSNALSYVIQKHDATRLHYDFRLEWGGVLKSWAVTRGPSLDPSEKRLAVHVEDHPLAYGGFEGTIPKGEYGGGTVMLWDRGSWEPEGDPDKGLEKGKLTFTLHGERLKGKWSLVRMHPRPGEKNDNWLLIKNDDKEARKRGDVLNKYTKSVESDRTMNAIARSDEVWHSSKKKEGRAKTTGASRRKMPVFQEPQLAMLVDEAPEGGEWLSEMKYDGYRALIAIAGGKAVIYTRHALDWTHKFPSIAGAAAALPTDGTLLDGEIVAYSSSGKTDFSSLQQALKSGEGELSCFVFDMLREDGKDISRMPLLDRKERLEALLAEAGPPLIYSTHVRGHAPEVYDKICAAGHEGIVVKRADAPYRAGRGRDWLKVKCSKRQELVIGGYAPSDKRGRPFSSILVGVHEDGKFVYKGRVGSGFTEETLSDLAEKFAERVQKKPPFDSIPRPAARGVKFVRPDLVAEIEFAEFTGDGMVRHGVFKGLRQDKLADEVVLEAPKNADKVLAGPADEEVAMETNEMRETFAGVKLSHPDKVLFKEQGLTKADLAAHYERVEKRIIPFLRNRLVSLVRCPEGSSGECFFQKHEHKGFVKEIKRAEITEKDGAKATYLHADDLAGLVAGVQIGTLEFHIWGSRLDKLEQPDRLVFDLDPDEGLDFGDVKSAAVDIRDRLEKLGLKSVPLLTGGKGVHVVAPLERRAEWPNVKQFARDFARLMAEEEPERYVAQALKAKRKGRIFIDWLRNERGATAIAPYSTRAREGAPVATPVSWGEFAEAKGANIFHLSDMEARMKEPDPWAESTTWRQPITKAMLEAVAE